MLLGSDFRSISGLRNDLLPLILPCSRDTIGSIGGRCDPPEGGGFIGDVLKIGNLFFGNGNGVEEDSEVIVAPTTEEFADDKG